MADEMGLGELPALMQEDYADGCREDITVHRPTVDFAKTIANSREADM